MEMHRICGYPQVIAWLFVLLGKVVKVKVKVIQVKVIRAVQF